MLRASTYNCKWTILTTPTDTPNGCPVPCPFSSALLYLSARLPLQCRSFMCRMRRERMPPRQQTADPPRKCAHVNFRSVNFTSFSASAPAPTPSHTSQHSQQFWIHLNFFLYSLKDSWDQTPPLAVSELVSGMCTRFSHAVFRDGVIWMGHCIDWNSTETIDFASLCVPVHAVSGYPYLPLGEIQSIEHAILCELRNNWESQRFGKVERGR